MRTMSEDAIRQRAAELGATYIGASEYRKLLDALETLSLESERLESTPHAELTEAEYQRLLGSLFRPTP